MKNVINEHLPAIWEMPHNRSVYSHFISEKESLRPIEHIMLDMAYDFGHCHVFLPGKGEKWIDFLNELPDYILIKGREFKKNLEEIYVKCIRGRDVPCAIYTAADGNIKEAPDFIWLKKSQIRPTRILTMKY